ncbi:uncharacterized protein LOC108743566 [Agrilus planipennis]|uniref:Uncharacterized protein LOC108743566 n=1 Tax=Agrilus planipennis TaxID=224129 RepID=A0A1W4XQ66_AGRPL|nr:uncharacterized protein LOC108743566 [Agrilus planipennis]
MIFTLFYMYATALQWWKLGVLKNKLSGTLNSHNALLVCNNSNFLDRKRRRCLENLLVQKGDRLACTIVPKQVLDLAQWAAIPKDNKYFPIFMKINKFFSKSPKMYVLVQTNLDSYTPHQSATVEVRYEGSIQ